MHPNGETPGRADGPARPRKENAALTGALGGQGARQAPGGTEGHTRGRRARTRGWTLLAAVLLTFGSLLAPMAVAASWAKVQLSDTQRFVVSYSPLARDGRIQTFITAETLAVIEEHVDIAELTDQVFDGITELGTGPAATKALEALKGPAAQGVTSLVESTVASFVASDAFAQTWEDALRLTHAQLTATLQNDPRAAVAIGQDGSVGVQLGPIVERVKSELLQRGMTFAEQIPAVNRTITVTHAEQLPSLQLVYNLALAAGAWLPWTALLFLAAGVLVARRRHAALVWAGLGLALAMVMLLGGLAVGRTFFVGSVSPALIPVDVARLLFGTVTSGMAATGVSALVLAVCVAVAAWFSGPFPPARGLRSLFVSGAAWVRSSAEGHGVSTGRTGTWLHSHRTLVRAAIATGAAAIILFVRPLGVGVILWTVAGAVAAVAAVELMRRPPAGTVGGDQPGDGAAAVSAPG
ncbi:hypothetical protein CVV67_15255 [Arthrobacter stackebrandtii]|nr:hypothetical protein CVV67_15255 [Arthrobacter stackebrandtii]